MCELIYGKGGERTDRMCDALVEEEQPLLVAQVQVGLLLGLLQGVQR